MQALGDVGAARALAGEAQHLALAFAQRIGFAPRGHGELRVDRAAAGVYLALRAPVLLAGGDAAYAVDPAWMPRQWLAYHLFVLRPSTFEVAGLWNASWFGLGVAALLWLALWGVVLNVLGIAAFAWVVARPPAGARPDPRVLRTDRGA